MSSLLPPCGRYLMHRSSPPLKNAEVCNPAALGLPSLLSPPSCLPHFCAFLFLISPWCHVDNSGTDRAASVRPPQTYVCLWATPLLAPAPGLMGVKELLCIGEAAYTDLINSTRIKLLCHKILCCLRRRKEAVTEAAAGKQAKSIRAVDYHSFTSQGRQREPVGFCCRPLIRPFTQRVAWCGAGVVAVEVWTVTVIMVFY